MLNSCRGPAPDVAVSEKGDPLEELWGSLQEHYKPATNSCVWKKKQASRLHLLNFQKFDTSIVVFS